MFAAFPLFPALGATFCIFWLSPMIRAQVIDSAPCLLPLGNITTGEGWQAVPEKSPDPASPAILGEMIFSYSSLMTHTPGWYKRGQSLYHDGTRDWRPYYGLQMEVRVRTGKPIDLRVTLATPFNKDHPENEADISVAYSIENQQWEKIIIPFSQFAANNHSRAFLPFTQSLRLSAAAPPSHSFFPHAPGNSFDLPAQAGLLEVKNVGLIRSPDLIMTTPVAGLTAAEKKEIFYPVKVGNCTDQPRDVTILLDQARGKIPIEINPRHQIIPSGQYGTFTIKATLPDSLAPGEYEAISFTAATLTSPDTAPVRSSFAVLTLYPTRELPHPFLLRTPKGWAELRQIYSSKKIPPEMSATLRDAETWIVPESRMNGPMLPPDEAYVFSYPESIKLKNTACAWQLTRNKIYAKKVVTFLLRLSDPQTGYPATLSGSEARNNLEFSFFKNSAIAYDLIIDSDLLTPGDRQQIDFTFRLHIETWKNYLAAGNLHPSALLAATSCFYSALVMEDLSQASTYIDGPCGFKQFLNIKMMSDGWWRVGTNNSALKTLQYLSEMALAGEAWRLGLKDLQVPALTHTQFNSPIIELNRRQLGIALADWGPQTATPRSLKKGWDAVFHAADYRGVIVGVNENRPSLLSSEYLDLAYYLYRDSAYLPLLNLYPWHDYLYTVSHQPEVPFANAPAQTQSHTAENIGFTILRSQTARREPRDQIQAILKFGNHGGWPGHFNRTDLLALTRYGHNYMTNGTVPVNVLKPFYRFYNQSSLAHNMVVVDGKMQEAAPAPQLLFYQGKAMQVSVAQTYARWCDPPNGDKASETITPATPPKSGPVATNSLALNAGAGHIGTYSDPILQRRLVLVTDDYVLVADYLKAEYEHDFDAIYHLKGFQDLHGQNIRFVRHTARMNSDPENAGQYITDCNWYQARAPVVSRFLYTNLNEPRVYSENYIPAYQEHGYNSEENRATALADPVRLNVHALWPPQQEIMLATPPYDLQLDHLIQYRVDTEDVTLQEGEMKTGICETADINVSVARKDKLFLQVKVLDKNNAQTLFWVNPRLILRDGSEMPLIKVTNPQPRNIITLPEDGKDYAGGPIKVAGQRYVTALPTQPEDVTKFATWQIDLTGLEAVRFQATLGGDYPIGNENIHRKLMSLHSRGTEAYFMTILEPYDADTASASILDARCTSRNKVIVRFYDGREQKIEINGFDQGLIQIKQAPDHFDLSESFPDSTDNEASFFTAIADKLSLFINKLGYIFSHHPENNINIKMTESKNGVFHFTESTNDSQPTAAP